MCEEIEMEIENDLIIVEGSGAVSSVNGQVGDVILGASDIDFSDGDTFQEKYDNGELTGPAGATGTTGTNGTNGVDGTNGADGESAYQIAVDNGYVGTETEWLESLKGADGTNGTDGTNGVDGTNGTDGADGLTTSVTVNDTTYEQVDGNIDLGTIGGEDYDYYYEYEVAANMYNYEKQDTTTEATDMFTEIYNKISEGENPKLKIKAVYASDIFEQIVVGYIDTYNVYFQGSVIAIGAGNFSSIGVTAQVNASSKIVRSNLTEFLFTPIDDYETTIPSAFNKSALSTVNTKSYTPTADYHPSTKKYVDDLVGDINSVLDTINGEEVE